MTVDDAYAELGLLPGASLSQAKAAWRGLVSRWHPDRNVHNDASVRMQRINRALAQIRGALGGAGDSEAESDVPAEAARGAPREAAHEARPAHLVQRHVKLTLEEAATGCVKVLRGTLRQACGPCAGTGQALAPQDCAACAGLGTLRDRVWFGWYGPAVSCTACDGQGQLRPPCTACDGSGQNETLRYRVSVRLPRFVRDGDQLQVRSGHGASSLLLDIQVALLPHAALLLDDDGSLRCELAVDGFGWVANREVEVPTLHGLQPLALQRGQVLYRLAGQGFPARRGAPPSDQIVVVVPRFPAALSPQQTRWLDQLAASTSGPPLA